MDLLEQRLGVGILGHLLARLRLLERGVGVPPADAEDSDGEACLAHAGQLLGGARDAVVGHAAEDRALDSLAWEGGCEALGCAGELPVLDEGGGHAGLGWVGFDWVGFETVLSGFDNRRVLYYFNFKRAQRGF